MVPFLALVISFLLFSFLGRLGVPGLRRPFVPLRGALAVMFVLTASAHFGPGREDLIRMVPPAFPHPDMIVTVTGILEILGAGGLLTRRFARPAALNLALLVAAMFPANVYAALNGLELMGRAVTPLVLRTFMQVLFVAALLHAADLRGERRTAEVPS